LGDLYELIECAYGVAHVELRPVVARYASREISSNSLPREELRRLFPKGEIIQFDAPRNKLNPHHSVAHEKNGGDPNQTIFPIWIGNLLQAPQESDPRGALTALANTRNAEPLARILAEFGVSLLATGSSSGERVKRRALPEVLESLAKSMGPFVNEDDVAQLDEQATLELYRNAISSEPIRKRLSLVRWIREFEFYLGVTCEKRKPVRKAAMPWVTEPQSEVDADLAATHEEHQTILNHIDRDWDAKDSDLRKRIIRLVVILEFRCGLRRNEVGNLRISDALFRGSSPELLVWPRKGDPRKSRNANRRVPVGVFLSPNEIEEIRSWYHQRTKIDEADPEDFLFALPEEELLNIPKSLFQKLNAFMRRISKSFSESSNDGIHGHTLRHAFGGWLFLSMLLSELENPPELFPDLEATSAWLSRGPEIREALYRHGQSTQKHPYLVARLAGHASFGTTAHSYVHLFPWLLAAVLDRSDVMKPDERLVLRASQTAESTLRDWIQRGGLHQIPVSLLRL
jgi:integrase